MRTGLTIHCRPKWFFVEPSDFEFRRVRQDDDFDMEIVNELYGKDRMIIPHRRYDLITGEFNEKEHHRYLGSKEEIWDPQKGARRG